MNIDHPLNEIINFESNWVCTLFGLDCINAGNLYISSEDYLDIDVRPFSCSYRLYQKSKKIVISGAGNMPEKFAVLTLSFDLWKCMVCKKISPKTDPTCFCGSYSSCWTPINGVVTGYTCVDSLDSLCYFDNNNVINIAYE